MGVDDVRDDRYYAAWVVFATTGMRRGELAALRWSDLDLDQGILTIRHHAPVVDGRVVWSDGAKTQAGERTVSLDPVTIAALREHRRQQLQERLLVGPGWVDDRGLVFTLADGQPIHPRRWLRWLQSRTKGCGLSATDVHALRHSYATAALRAGVSPEVLAARIGHRDVSTTLRTYAHVRPQDDRDAALRAASSILGG